MRQPLIQAATTWKAPLSRATIAILLAVLAMMPASFNLDAAGSLTSLRDTLSTSRPSVYTAITGSVTAGDTTIPVANTNGIVQNDTITLCTTNTCATSETKVVAAILSQTQLALTVGTTNPFTASSFAIYKATSKHTITFTTRSAVTAGKFIVTLPGDGNVNNGIPGANGYDFGGITTAEITLTGGTAGTIATSSPSSNVVITIPFTGTIAATTAITITVGTTARLLNPTKTAVQGTADITNVQIDETDGSNNVVDTTIASLGTIEPVSVSATVTPSFTFTINPVAASAAVAGATTDVATTATTVPFGNLVVNTNRTAAQFIHIDTNSNSGYIVTAQSDGSLRKTNGTVISDYNVNGADNASNNGFGYSLQDKTNTPSSFHYNDSGTFYSKGFNSSTPVTIMQNGSPASGDESYVVYRVRVGATQPQGTYQNLVTYIATAIY